MFEEFDNFVHSCFIKCRLLCLIIIEKETVYWCKNLFTKVENYALEKYV